MTHDSFSDLVFDLVRETKFFCLEFAEFKEAELRGQSVPEPKLRDLNHKFVQILLEHILLED